MKSSLTMVLDGATTQPAIKLSLLKTDDLRDSVFQVFTEKFAGVSEWCRVEFNYPPGVPGETPDKVLLISPISSHDNLASEFYKIAKRVKEHTPEYYDSILKQLWQDQYPPKRLSDNLEKNGVRITRDEDNNISVEAKSDSKRYDACSLKMIEMIRFVLASITSSSESNQGHVFRALQDLSREMPVLCGLQSEPNSNTSPE